MNTMTEPRTRRTLGQLTEDWLEFVRRLEDAGGELTPDLQGEFDLLADALKDKADAIAHTLQSLDVQESALRTKAQEFAAMARARKNAAERLDAYVVAMMQKGQTKKLTGDVFTLELGASKRLVVDDAAQVPPIDRYWRRPAPEVNREAVKRDVTEGAAVPGVHLESHYFVRVK